MHILKLAKTDDPKGSLRERPHDAPCARNTRVFAAPSGANTPENPQSWILGRINPRKRGEHARTQYVVWPLPQTKMGSDLCDLNPRKG